MSKKIRVSGSVQDFQSRALEGAEIHFQDGKFRPLFSTKSDIHGKFSIEIEDRKYGSVFICKDYSKNYLEYWHWDYQPSISPIINAKIDGIELYGMKAWSTAPAYPGMIVYFRPMSLEKYKKLDSPDKNKAASICPELSLETIVAKINNQHVTIWGLNRVQEFISENESMGAYLLHLATKDVLGEIKTVSLDVHDPLSGEFGMGCVDLGG